MTGQAAQELARIRSGMDQIRALIDLPPAPRREAHQLLQLLCRDPMPRAALAGGTAAVIDLSSHLRRAPVAGAGASMPDRAAHTASAWALAPVSAPAWTSGPAPRAVRAAGREPAAVAASDPSQAFAAASIPTAGAAPGAAPAFAPAQVDAQAPQAAPATAPALASAPAQVPTPVPAPLSRIGRLLAAWADWLTWRLMPPAIPGAPGSGGISAPGAIRTGTADLPAELAADLAADLAAVAPATRGAASPWQTSCGAAPQGEYADGPGAAAVHATAPAGAPSPSGQAEAASPNCGPGAQVHRLTAAPPHATAPQATGAALAADLLRDPALRAHLHEMIREELEGEMGQRFSGNLRAVVRREVASRLDDRLTHL